MLQFEKMFVIICMVDHVPMCTNACQYVLVVIGLFYLPGCFADMSFFFARMKNQSEKYLNGSLYKGVYFMLINKIFILGRPGSGKSAAGRYIAMLAQDKGFPHRISREVSMSSISRYLI